MSSKKRGLGKGLSALISDNITIDTVVLQEDSKETIESISLDLIRPKVDQPRKSFDDKAIEELAHSISIHGLIQPIILRKMDNNYEIIAGERRFKAVKSLGLKEIPAIIRSLDEENSAKLSLIENIQREDLNPIEEALAYNSLIQDYGIKQEQLGNTLGKSRSYVSNVLRLLNLHEKIIEYIYEGKLSSGHGKVLLGLKNQDEQVALANRIIFEKLSVRDTEEILKRKRTSKPKKEKVKDDPYIQDVEETLMRSLGTKVKLQSGKKIGKIEIEYYGNDDLDRIIDLLTW